MGDKYRFIVSPWLMRAAIGAALVGSMALFPPAPAAAPKEELLEQVGAYTKLENAATMVEALRIEGRNAFIRQKNVDGRTVFVVLVEPKLIKEKKETRPAAKPAAKPASKKETAKPAAKPAPKNKTAKPASKPYEPKMETVIVTDTMPPASVAPPAPEKKGSVAPVAPAAPVPAASAPVEKKGSVAPAAPAAPVPAASAPVEKKGAMPPAPVVLPVTRADATESIEAMSDVYVYDRPFATGKPIGTYAETGGAYVKEFKGWYAIKLPSGKSGFIKKEDADIINVAVPAESPAQSPAIAPSQSAPAPAN